MLSNILVDSVLNSFSLDKSTVINACAHNRDGYFEDVKLTLINDQIISLKYGSTIHIQNLFEVILDLLDGNSFQHLARARPRIRHGNFSINAERIVVCTDVR